MRINRTSIASLTFLLLLAVSAGCATRERRTADTGAPATGFRCVDCLASSDCGDDQCIQYAMDVACVSTT